MKDKEFKKMLKDLFDIISTNIRILELEIKKRDLEVDQLKTCLECKEAQLNGKIKQ
jgi:hypothetical protein